MTCPLITGKPGLPSVSLEKHKERCLEPTHDTILNERSPVSFTCHERQGWRYFASENRQFFTPDNLNDQRVHAVVDGIVGSIQQCELGHMGGDHDIVIIMKCINERAPKYDYYIADHTTKRVCWGHERQFKEYSDDYHVGMRNNAEYWHHRSKFCEHRPYTQDDLHELRELLDGMENSSGASLPRDDIQTMRNRIDQISPRNVGEYTAELSAMHSRALKAEVTDFYERNLSFKCKLLKSLNGFSRRLKFMHSRVHQHGSQANSPAPSTTSS